MRVQQRRTERFCETKPERSEGCKRGSAGVRTAGCEIAVSCDVLTHAMRCMLVGCTKRRKGSNGQVVVPGRQAFKAQDTTLSKQRDKRRCQGEGRGWVSAER